MNHFENLWTEAEAIVIEPQNEGQALKELLVDVANYQMVDGFRGNSPAGYVENGKKKVIGDMLLHVAHLSAVANIDVYAALQQAMESAILRKQTPMQAKPDVDHQS